VVATIKETIVLFPHIRESCDLGVTILSMFSSIMNKPDHIEVTALQENCTSEFAV